MARYEWEYARRRGPGYDMTFGNWNERSNLRGYDRGYGRGWGMTGLFRSVRYGEEYPDNTPTPYHTAEDVRGLLEPRARGRGYTGMESNRYRGVYGSDFRVGYDRDLTRHGGYRGAGQNRGGGMNPGRPARYEW